jgi:hypothetical protein
MTPDQGARTRCSSCGGTSAVSFIKFWLKFAAVALKAHGAEPQIIQSCPGVRQVAVLNNALTRCSSCGGTTLLVELLSAGCHPDGLGVFALHLETRLPAAW